MPNFFSAHLLAPLLGYVELHKPSAYWLFIRLIYSGALYISCYVAASQRLHGGSKFSLDQNNFLSDSDIFLYSGLRQRAP